jgi:thymidine phosphorylase
MINLGTDRGCAVVALITAMDRPLGRACGNALEVEEAIHTLRGEGPPDVLGVTYALGAEMLVLGGAAPTLDAARRAMEVAISSGKAARKFEEIIDAQGGNAAVVDDPSVLPQAGACELVLAPRVGVVARVEPRAVGRILDPVPTGALRRQGDFEGSVALQLKFLEPQERR